MVLDMQQGNHAPVAALVDVTTIEHLSDIWQDEEWIVIGAAATHTAIEAHPLVRKHGQALVESCGVVGGPQVRNVATIGGNVAHALPAADGAIGLLALGAEVQVCTLDGEDLTCTWQPLLSIYAGPGRNQLQDNQLLAAFRFPAVQARQGSAFDRIMRPQGVALPILGVAAKLTLDESLTRVTAAAIVVGPAGPLPFPCHHSGTGVDQCGNNRRAGDRTGHGRGPGPGPAAHQQTPGHQGLSPRAGGGAAAAGGGACSGAGARGKFDGRASVAISRDGSISGNTLRLGQCPWPADLCHLRSTCGPRCRPTMSCARKNEYILPILGTLTVSQLNPISMFCASRLHPMRQVASAGTRGLFTVPTLLEIRDLAPEVHDRYIEIRTPRNGEVITIIELLSPFNKRPGAQGFQAFQEKRREVMASHTHWIEIDLLRAGVRPPEVAYKSDYYALLKRG